MCVQIAKYFRQELFYYRPPLGQFLRNIILPWLLKTRNLKRSSQPLLWQPSGKEKILEECYAAQSYTLRKD